MAGGACGLCGGETFFRFSLPLAGGLEGRYHECRRCGMLQSGHLERLTPGELSSFIETTGDMGLDTGDAWRQFNVVNRLRELARLRVLPGKRWGFKVLDYGCGSGFTGSSLAFAFRWDVTLFDPYSEPAFHAGEFTSDMESVIAGAPYDLIIATEVFEHFTNPRAEITRLGELLDPEGSCAYVTTGLYKPGVTGPDWKYLTPGLGQHVAFYSRSAMVEAAKLMGAFAAQRVGAEYEWLFARKDSRAGALRRGHVSLTCRALSAAADLGLVPKIE